MQSAEQIILRPIITEKTTNAKAEGSYVFAVDTRASKITIRMAVEKLFKVKVLSVNTINVSGKKRQLGKKTGTTSSWKKAYVKLAGGQKIDMIEGMM
jgi:large subunit ribosomal protein L23